MEVTRAGLAIVMLAVGAGAASAQATATRATVQDVGARLQQRPIEQTRPGERPAAALVASFDGLGHGFVGPQGTAVVRNPSDNSLAVGPDHIVEIVNSRMAIYTKQGALFDTTGVVLFGPVPTNVVFTGLGGQCEPRPNGDAVVRYDQLAQRWLYVMPIFRRPDGDPTGPYAMCYAVSTGTDPLGPFHRYEFKRPLFPDYPRPAIWPDGYYVPTSTGDDVIEKHACVVDRISMLQGGPATEQCVIIKDVNFLNNADIDGYGVPPAGAPNIMMATGGTQLREDYDDDGIYAWEFHVDWKNPANTQVTGPTKFDVAPYHYLCNGQLTNCVPQPGTERRLDAQGDKLMQRLVYRNLGTHEAIVALHSVNTTASGGGVRWYEFRLDQNRKPYLYQQSTYAPDSNYRWMGSIGVDRQGNIGIGYSFGGATHFPGQRFAARYADEARGLLSLRETVLVDGRGVQTNTLRWQDYTTLVMDPSDDCTFWYVGDYYKANAPTYTTRIGAFRLLGCLRANVSGSVFFDMDHDGYRDPGERGLPNRTVTYSGGVSGSLTTDDNGNFSTWLPADPAYFTPSYTFSQREPMLRNWTRTPQQTLSRRAVSTSGDAFVVQLTDRVDINALHFGHSCTTQNTGAMLPTYWASSAAEPALRAQTPAWRRLLNTTLYLQQRDGARFTVADSTATAYVQLQAWLSDATTTTAEHALSQQLAATALNAAFGSQDGNVTVLDPVMGDWATVNTIVTRASALLAAPARAEVRAAYHALLEQLNNNTAVVTPTAPVRCAS